MQSHCALLSMACFQYFVYQQPYYPARKLATFPCPGARVTFWQCNDVHRICRAAVQLSGVYKIIVSDREIAYDVRLEEQLEEVKFKMWLNEELQIQPKKYHSSIKKSSIKFLVH